MNYLDTLHKIINALEENHINLYHDISKEEVYKKVAEIDKKNIQNDVEFDAEMMKLFALFKDAHTTYKIPNKNFDKQIAFVGDDFYIRLENKWQKISCFGNLDADKFIEKSKEYIPFETEAWFKFELRSFVINLYFHKMLGLLNEDNSLALKLENNKTIVLYPKTETKIQSKSPKPPYSYKILDDNILYFRYRSCVEDKDYPFSKFINDMVKELDERGITKYILDVRCNTGGNSEIINPFQDLVHKRGLTGVMIIDNGVFSSGRFAVARFKKDFNITLIGEETGGAAKSYGYMKMLEVDGKRFSVSLRLWDFSSVFGCTGSIQPDIYVPLTIEDLENNRDSQLETAIKEINKIRVKEQKEI